MFYIDSDRLSSIEEDLNEYKNELKKIKDDVGNVRTANGISSSSFSTIKKHIRAISAELGNEKSKIGSMCASLQTIRKQYIDCEARIINNVVREEVKRTVEEAKGKQWYDNIPKDVLKTILDVIGKAGDVGGQLVGLNSILKVIIDNDGFTYKDVGTIFKGTGQWIINADKLLKKESWELSDLFNTATYETINISPQAGWLQRLKSAPKAAKDTFAKELIGDSEGKKISGSKVAGWAVALVANGFSNYEEYSKGEISGERAVAETVVETGIDILKGAAISSALVAGSVAIGLAAPAVVVSGVAMAASTLLDIACKQFTGKKVTEFVSDAILDGGEMLVNGAVKAVSNIGNAVKDTFTGAVKSIGNIMPKWKWSFG